MHRLGVVPVEATGLGASGPVHSCHLNRRGLECLVLEPSPAMLAQTREREAELGARPCIAYPVFRLQEGA